MSAQKKHDSKSFARQRRNRRKFLTFIRMCRYGINNFTRNAWLTVAATAVMTITLFVIFASLVSRNILIDTANDIRDHVSMSIYLKYDTSDSDANRISDQLKDLKSVVSVTYTTPDEARTAFVQENADSQATLNAVEQAPNQFPGTLNIKVVNINDTSELSKFVSNDALLKQDIDQNHAPSFAGTRRVAIDKIGQAVDFAQKFGLIVSLIFVVMSTLIIFNTIRMAIFNRREEINMMKLIGAEQSFIRGPFIVEAVVYGFFAALIATAGGFATLYAITPSIIASGVNIQPTVDLVTFYIGFVLLGMIVAGALIGVISSLLATRRYLKL